MTPLEWVYLVATIVSTFLGGAVVEAETTGAITRSINYEINATREPVCKEYFPLIIITDEHNK